MNDMNDLAFLMMLSVLAGAIGGFIGTALVFFLYWFN